MAAYNRNYDCKNITFIEISPIWLNNLKPSERKKITFLFTISSSPPLALCACGLVGITTFFPLVMPLVVVDHLVFSRSANEQLSATDLVTVGQLGRTRLL